MSPALDRLPQRPFASVAAGRFRFVAVLAIVTAFYALCLHYADIDLERLWTGIPRLIAWAMRAWPPDFAELDLLLARALETLAIATIGTTIGAVIAVPACVLAARNLTPNSFLRTPARWVLNALRGIDSFVFALLFVAAVGLGPFAGVLGVALHSAGTIAKLWSEAIEAIEPGPIEAVAMTGATRTKIVVFAVLPDVLPSLTSIVLYVWEVNARASTVLGLVGAGGIGQELKNSVDLLLFPRVFAILIIILVMVTAIDQLSAWLRRRLV
ncbi:MAG: phosphonate ABC transporter, permease protein PhnE [Alphaproteobacteria bacterium]|nr:phosphonate ABC transporter, permease protein PhnE [Alphaproteobacteria bacterium]